MTEILADKFCNTLLCTGFWLRSLTVKVLHSLTVVCFSELSFKKIKNKKSPIPAVFTDHLKYCTSTLPLFWAGLFPLLAGLCKPRLSYMESQSALYGDFRSSVKHGNGRHCGIASVVVTLLVSPYSVEKKHFG